MQAIYKELKTLDERCYEKFSLSEDVLMEQAANALHVEVLKHSKKAKKVCIICGSGNNGGDGLACARMLYGKFEISIVLPYGAKSKMAKIQLKRVEALGLKIDENIQKADIYIDALFGSGLNKSLDIKAKSILNYINKQNAVKISCDMPTGLYTSGKVDKDTFQADTTITMGALKESLFLDASKSYVGKIKVANLGIQRCFYETKTETFLLNYSDIKLPYRKTQNVNKGTFGHLSILCGEKQGAGILAALAGFSFGAGLVSLVGKVDNLPIHLMNVKKPSQNSTCIVAGMGLGNAFDEEELYEFLISNIHPIVMDADLCYMPIAKELLFSEKEVICTPHPKEFSALLKQADVGSFSVEEIQQNRFELARVFSKKCNATLVLKGANTIISHKGELYVCDKGNSSLAKGGSGDVLAGLIGALMAQGYSTKDASITAVLAHAKAGKNFKKSSFSLKPQDIIEGVSCL